MNRIQKAFDEKKKVFIGFVTAGDPNLATTKELVRAMVKGGAGLIEFGIPFSDPVAEGEVIQKADMRALVAGTTTDKIFDLVAELREETQVPLVFLTYANPIYAYGAEKFFTRCEETGVDGVIIPDIPYEEREEMRPFSEPHNGPGAADCAYLQGPHPENRRCCPRLCICSFFLRCYRRAQQHHYRYRRHCGRGAQGDRYSGGCRLRYRCSRAGVQDGQGQRRRYCWQCD